MDGLDKIREAHQRLCSDVAYFQKHMPGDGNAILRPLRNYPIQGAGWDFFQRIRSKESAPQRVVILEGHRDIAQFYTKHNLSEGAQRSLDGGIKCGELFVIGGGRLSGQATLRRMMNATIGKPRQHKRRSNQSEAYHKRIQKKWNKRAKTDKRWLVWDKPVVLNAPPKLYEFFDKWMEAVHGNKQ